MTRSNWMRLSITVPVIVIVVALVLGSIIHRPATNASVRTHGTLVFAKHSCVSGDSFQPHDVNTASGFGDHDARIIVTVTDDDGTRTQSSTGSCNYTCGPPRIDIIRFDEPLEILATPQSAVTIVYAGIDEYKITWTVFSGSVSDLCARIPPRYPDDRIVFRRHTP